MDPARIAGCQRQVSRPHRRKKFFTGALDPVGRLVASRHPGQGSLAIQIEKERDRRPAVTDGKRVDPCGLVRRDPARHPLVDRGRVHEAVGNHDPPGLEGRRNDLAHELRPACGKEQELGFGREGFALRSMLEQMPDHLARGRPARLAQEQRLPAARRKKFCQPPDLG